MTTTTSASYYNWHRYYQPEHGRYTRRDPLGSLAFRYSGQGYENALAWSRFDVSELSTLRATKLSSMYLPASANDYTYALQAPGSNVDVTGLWSIGGSYCKGACAGFKLTCDPCTGECDVRLFLGGGFGGSLNVDPWELPSGNRGGGIGFEGGVGVKTPVGGVDVGGGVDYDFGDGQWKPRKPNPDLNAPGGVGFDYGFRGGFWVEF